MGYRMYCDTYPESTCENKDNESPKFFSYVKEPPSYKILHELYLQNKIKTLEDIDTMTYWELENYDNMCISNGTCDYILEASDFKIFMEQFLSDLADYGYKIRETYMECMKELIKNDSKKVIYWK